MKLADRIRLLRRKAGLSQEAFAIELGVQRSAVANWESASATHPSSLNLRRLAEFCNVCYEWLATGRGEMWLATAQPAVLTTDVDHYECPQERRMVEAYRQTSSKNRLTLLELAEAMAYQRTGKRVRQPPPPPQSG